MWSLQLRLLTKIVGQDIESYVLSWSLLQHPGLVPVLGITFVLGRHLPAIITPYYKNGSIIDFLKKHPRHDIIPIVRTLSEVHAIASC